MPFLDPIWPFLLPLLAGAAAVYLLLPRPTPYHPLYGAACGAAALILGAANLLKPSGISPEAILFFTFTAIALISGALLVTQQSPARAALSFTLVILSTSGLFLLLAAPFLMAANIIVYAGAIIVTFLFVIMLAQQEGLSDADARSREPALAVLSGLLLLGVLLHAIRLAGDNAEIGKLIEEARAFKATGKPLSADAVADGTAVEARAGLLLDRLGQPDLKNRLADFELGLKQKTEEEKKAAAAAVMDECVRLLTEARLRGAASRPRVGRPLSSQSGPSASTPADEVRRNPVTLAPEMPAESSAILGRSLFTDYLLPVELGGLLLLAATAGAIAIAQKHSRAAREERT
jgi:NADH:ubiquinone oxidoreductase subunit 6 (subunit J)